MDGRWKWLERGYAILLLRLARCKCSFFVYQYMSHNVTQDIYYIHNIFNYRVLAFVTRLSTTASHASCLVKWPPHQQASNFLKLIPPYTPSVSSFNPVSACSRSRPVSHIQ